MISHPWTYLRYWRRADCDDLPFFEAYIAEKGPETFLVTGNVKHFPERPYILAPRQMVGVLSR